jgi:microcystin-dependent protein
MAANTVQIANTGGNQAFNIMQPYQVINFQIALTGLFPSRT